jgi:hypothetical protein
VRYQPGEDDIASTALWYQTEPHAAFPSLPGLNQLEVISYFSDSARDTR